MHDYSFIIIEMPAYLNVEGGLIVILAAEALVIVF